MPGQQHRTPYWYRHSYHQPASLHFLAPPELRQPPPDLLLQPRGQIKENASARCHCRNYDYWNQLFRRFIRQKSSRERPRPSSISDLQYSVTPFIPFSPFAIKTTPPPLCKRINKSIIRLSLRQLLQFPQSPPCHRQTHRHRDGRSHGGRPTQGGKQSRTRRASSPTS